MLRLPATRQPTRRQGRSGLVIGAAAAAAAAVSLSGCGGPAKAATPAPGPATPTLAPALQGDPTAVVRGAAGKTLAAGNADLAVTVPVFQEGTLASVNGEGQVAFAEDRLRLVVPNAEKAEERQFGRSLYVLLPEQLSAGLNGKKWVQLDLDAPKPADPDPFKLYAYDPEQLLTAVSGISDAKLVGNEAVGDAPATHFTGSLDATAVAGTGVNRTFATAYAKATKGAATPVDVWLDDAGRIRRLSLPLAPPDAQLPAGSAPTTSVTLSGFGTADLSFTKPPAAEVADVSELATLAGGVGD